MRRLIVLRALVVVVVAVLIGRLYQLQLVDSESRRNTNSVDLQVNRYVPVTPRRGEILARDGKTLLAESVPIYNLAVMPDSLPPRRSVERAQVLSEVAQIATLTSTLTISPALLLDTTPNLRVELERFGSLPTILDASAPLTVTIAPANSMAVLSLSQLFTKEVTLNNPIEALISRDDVPRYQSLLVKEDIPHELALVMHENSAHLPGVIVVEDYRRHYPLSNEVQSLSHLLGYTGRINECQLLNNNPASSWLNSLLDTVEVVDNCRLNISREIDPRLRGIPPYLNDDRIGKDGLERSYENELRGSMGRDRLMVDARERPRSDRFAVQPVVNGNNLVLTIDLEFQQQTEAIVRRWIAESERRRQATWDYRRNYPPITNGVAVALDVRTGEVLSMVSLPDYDNNVYVDPKRANELQQLLNPAPEMVTLSPLINRAVTGRYPAGSTLKQFVGAIALQDGVISPGTQLRDPGLLLVRERSGSIYTFPNAVIMDRGYVTVSDALEYSSNVFFGAIAGGNNEVINIGPEDFRTNGLSIARLAEGLDWFGLGRATNINLPNEDPGLVPTPSWKAFTLREPWTLGNTYNTAIGQGYLEVTPLQLVYAAAAVANGGTLHRPQLVKHITDSNGKVVREMTPEVSGQVPVDPTYLRVIREGLRRSVTDGANVAARDACSGLSIAGKTGTAEFGNPFPDSNGRLIRRSHSWFVGFAPYNDPQIAVVVLLEGTGDLGDGSATLTVPAVTQIMQAYFKITPPVDVPDCPELPQ